MNALLITSEQRIVAKARKGLSLVHSGETQTMEGWLMYGAALNEGRELFPNGGQGDKDFGAWKVACQLDTPDRHDSAAAMWAAGNLSEYRETRQDHPRVRTVRGLHAKFKDNDKAAPAKAEPTADDFQTIAKLNTLAERGATEGERSSAKVKLDAYTSAFSGQQGEIIEQATAYAKEPDEKVVEKFETLLAMQPNQWLCKKLLQAMQSNKKFFNEIIKELHDNV